MAGIDVAIVGGGPAGLSAAIRARERGLEAVVWEPHETPVDKACGEGLMPAALEALAGLGVDSGALGGIPFEGVRYRDGADASCAAEGVFSGGCGRGVRRTELHRALRRRAEEVGVEFREERVADFDVGNERVHVGDEVARWLIGADGLHSDIGEQAGFGRSTFGPRRFGVRRHFRTPPWTSFVEVHWSRRGEAYITPVGSDRIGVAILSERGGRFDELLPAFPDLERRLRGVDVTSEDRGAGPFWQRADRVRKGRVLLVGDAAGYVDALTGEGVALAVETATAAVDAIADGEPARYDREWKRITRAYRWLTGLLVEITRVRPFHRPLIGLLDRFPALFDGCLELLGGAQESATSPVSSCTRPSLRQ